MRLHSQIVSYPENAYVEFEESSEDKLDWMNA